MSGSVTAISLQAGNSQCRAPCAARPAPRALRLMGQSLMEEKAEKYCQISQSAEL